MNTKFYAVVDANSRSLSFFVTINQVSDYTRPAALPDVRGYDADGAETSCRSRVSSLAFRDGDRAIEPVGYNKRRYRWYGRIDLMFGRREDRCCVAIRYDRCPTVSFSAVTLAVIFWLWWTVPDPNGTSVTAGLELPRSGDLLPNQRSEANYLW